MNNPIGGTKAAKLTMPSKSLLSGAHYVPACRSDIRQRFEWIRAERSVGEPEAVGVVLADRSEAWAWLANDQEQKRLTDKPTGGKA